VPRGPPRDARLRASTIPAVAWDDPALPAGLRSGDGVFETFRTFGGVPFLLEEHLARLRAGARAIGLAPLPSASSLRALVQRRLAPAVARRGPAEWIVRPALFSGPAGAEVAVGIERLPGGPEKGRSGLVTGVSGYVHPGRVLVPPGGSAPVKWLARGPLAAALRAGRRRGWDEALLADPSGGLVEGTRSNLFVVSNGTLHAPGPEAGALPGVTRAVVLREAGRIGIPVATGAVPPRVVRSATELFLTSSLLGVAPVARIEGLWRGSGHPGPKTLPEFLAAYDRAIARSTGRAGAASSSPVDERLRRRRKGRKGLGASGGPRPTSP